MTTEKLTTENESSRERSSKLFALLLLGLAMLLILFKFVPDLGTATLPNQGPSLLTDVQAFRSYYQTPGSVMNPRFAGTSILLALAGLIGRHVHSTDVRLYPLRIAAGILTPLYAFVGLIPVFAFATRYCWRTYATLYGVYCVLSLYVFYPYDMPSIALISVAAFLVLEEQFGPALLVMMLTGIFRESSLHIVCFVAVWAYCRQTRPKTLRARWVLVFAATYTLEYLLIHRFYPGHTGVTFDLHEIFFGGGLWSFTCIVTLSLLAIVPLFYLVQNDRSTADWRKRFFRINCALTPGWILFYRVVGGNISELRMLVPVLLPLFYGFALRRAQTPNIVIDRSAADMPAA